MRIAINTRTDILDAALMVAAHEKDMPKLSVVYFKQYKNSLNICSNNGALVFHHRRTCIMNTDFQFTIDRNRLTSIVKLSRADNQEVVSLVWDGQSGHVIGFHGVPVPINRVQNLDLSITAYSPINTKALGITALNPALTTLAHQILARASGSTVAKTNATVISGSRGQRCLMIGDDPNCHIMISSISKKSPLVDLAVSEHNTRRSEIGLPAHHVGTHSPAYLSGC